MQCSFYKSVRNRLITGEEAISSRPTCLERHLHKSNANMVIRLGDPPRAGVSSSASVGMIRANLSDGRLREAEHVPSIHAVHSPLSRCASGLRPGRWVSLWRHKGKHRISSPRPDAFRMSGALLLVHSGGSELDWTSSPTYKAIL